MDRISILAGVGVFVLGVIAPIITKRIFDRSDLAVQAYFRRPPLPDERSAKLINARIVEESGRYVVKIRNESSVPILDVRVEVVGETRDLGAIRAGGELSEVVPALARIDTPPNVWFSIGEDKWLIANGQLSRTTSEQVENQRSEEAGRSRKRRMIAWTVLVAGGLAFIAWSLWPTFFPGPPERVRYIVSPSRIGTNPFGGVFDPIIGGINKPASIAWSEGSVAASWSSRPDKYPDPPTDAPMRGEEFVVVCLTKVDGNSDRLARDGFDRWMWARDLRAESNLMPMVCQE